MANKTAVLDMLGAGCANCAYAIERLGRKRIGIEDIRVDIARGEIRVVYDAPDAVLKEIIAIVNTIGHDAVVKSIRGEDSKND